MVHGELDRFSLEIQIKNKYDWFLGDISYGIGI